MHWVPSPPPPNRYHIPSLPLCLSAHSVSCIYLYKDSKESVSLQKYISYSSGVLVKNRSFTLYHGAVLQKATEPYPLYMLYIVNVTVQFVPTHAVHSVLF
jgi:hypothetical protein